MIKAIIFDADGPLYYRNLEVLEQQLALLNQYGYPGKLTHGHVAHINKYGHLGNLEQFDTAYDKEKFRAYVHSESAPVMIKHILHSLGLDLSEADLQHFAVEFKKLHTEITSTPSAVPTLKQLKAQGFKTCVLTDSFYSSDEKWQWFRAIGLGDVLDYVVSSYDIRTLKNTPEAYVDCLQLLQTSEDETIFVGHQQYEMDGAKAARVRSVAILPIATPDIQADYTINDLSELPDLLVELNKVDRQP
jgi:FMN phosphatase YigB (HAD superfamily)